MNVNTKVTGTYLSEFPIKGIISEVRQLITPPYGFEHVIELETPIIVYGALRKKVTVVTNWDGTATTYSKFPDMLNEL
jgi:hypothetical protein